MGAPALEEGDLYGLPAAAGLALDGARGMQLACFDDGENKVFLDLPDCSRNSGDFAAFPLFDEAVDFLGVFAGVTGGLSVTRGEIMCERGAVFFMSDMAFSL